jgi:hypothetical protein
MKNSLLLYEDVPRYDSWLKPLLSGFVAFFLLLGLIFLYFNTELAIVMFILTAFMALLIAAIVPRRFLIFEDRLRIQLGGPFALNIPLENIDKARHGSSGDVLVYWGIKLGTSTSNVIEIVRNKGMNVIITPTHFNEFLNQLNQAVQPKSENPAT